MKSCCGDVTLWVLLEVPPHGGGGPWPRMTVGVAEWAMGNADDGKRAFSRAGRRSAGLGSDGGARTYTHAVGVRAYGVVCVPQTKRGGVGDGAICSVVVHTRLFDGAKVVC